MEYPSEPYVLHTCKSMYNLQPIAKLNTVPTEAPEKAFEQHTTSIILPIKENVKPLAELERTKIQSIYGLPYNPKAYTTIVFHNMRNEISHEFFPPELRTKIAEPHKVFWTSNQKVNNQLVWYTTTVSVAKGFVVYSRSILNYFLKRLLAETDAYAVEDSSLLVHHEKVQSVTEWLTKHGIRFEVSDVYASDFLTEVRNLSFPSLTSKGYHTITHNTKSIFTYELRETVERELAYELKELHANMFVPSIDLFYKNGVIECRVLGRNELYKVMYKLETTHSCLQTSAAYIIVQQDEKDPITKESKIVYRLKRIDYKFDCVGCGWPADNRMCGCDLCFECFYRTVKHMSINDLINKQCVACNQRYEMYHVRKCMCIVFDSLRHKPLVEQLLWPFVYHRCPSRLVDPNASSCDGKIHIVQNTVWTCDSCSFMICMHCTEDHIEVNHVCPSTARRCPSCYTPIEKSVGCVHMICKCGFHYDYNSETMEARQNYMESLITVNDSIEYIAYNIYKRGSNQRLIKKCLDFFVSMQAK